MFEHWDSFYLLVGGGAGALIGLVFIVVTLLRGGDAKTRLRAASVYMTPIVFNLSAVLVLSAVAIAPDLPAQAVGGILAAGAVVGLICSGRVVLMLGLQRSITPAHWTDIWAYGVGPVAGYLGVAAAAAAAWIAPDWAARLLGAGLVGLMLTAIRNAWDLVTWITAKGDELDKN